MNETLPLAQYSLEGASVTQMSGGAINTVYRVESTQGVFALKEYSGVPMDAERLGRVCEAMALARDAGLPVPRIVQTRDGLPFALHDGRLYVLTEFVDGRTYPAGTMPERAARNLGAVHARLLDALAGLGEVPVVNLPGLEWEDHLTRLLAIAVERRHESPVDEVACLMLEQKLRIFRAWQGPPPHVRAQWTHGDVQWRNVLFDEHDEVIAIFDFDNLRAADPGRDVLRCFTLGFPHGSPESLVYFEGYASAARITPEEAQRYVHVYHYMSAQVWPVDVRYLQPELYQARWDQFIEPRPLAWETGWDRLAEQLASIAERANSPSSG
ncbi:MAG TPA: phosphotransferase [Dehalococcoidia bacterium]|nr:phosphotransferase [Dehalococcoidia bacterium]